MSQHIEIIGVDDDVKNQFNYSVRTSVYITHNDQMFLFQADLTELKNCHSYCKDKGKEALRGVSFQIPLKTSKEYEIDIMCEKIVTGGTEIPIRDLNEDDYIVISFLASSFGLADCKIVYNKDGNPFLQFSKCWEMINAHTDSTSSARMSSFSRRSSSLPF